MIKIFDKDGYKNRGRLLGFGSGPDADWKVIFSAFVALIFLSVIYSGFIFYKSMNVDFGSETSLAAESPIDRHLLKQYTDIYKKKQTSFEELIIIRETIADPSK